MNKLLDGVKRLIALLLVVTLVGLSSYGMINDKQIPEPLVAMTGLVIGYYFGKGNNDE